MGTIVARNVYHGDTAVEVPIPDGDPSTWPARWWEGPGRSTRQDSATVRLSLVGNAAADQIPDLSHFDATVEYDSEVVRERMIKRMNADSRSYQGTTRANVKETAKEGISAAMGSGYYREG